MVAELTSIEEFTTAIGGEKNGLVVIDFYADWCGPCKKIAPFYSKLADKYASAQFYKINCDVASTKDVVKACMVSSLPSFCFFIGGKYINKMIGANESQLEELIVKFLAGSNN